MGRPYMFDIPRTVWNLITLGGEIQVILIFRLDLYEWNFCYCFPSMRRISPFLGIREVLE